MSEDQKRGLSRRAFVGKVTAGAAGGALAISVAARGASALSATGGTADGTPGQADDGQPGLLEPAAEKLGSSTRQATETAPAPWALVKPLNAGSALAGDWILRDLSGVVAGACVLTLANRRGREQRVHLCRNDGAPRGLVFTDRLDLVVMNGGRGDVPTEESFGRAVATLAHAIAANEPRVAVIDGLLSQTEREERFAATAQLR